MLDDMRDVNVGNWEWESGTFPESGVTIDDTDMIQGLGSNLFEDDSDSDANYDHFSDSDYGFTDEDDRLYDENVDVNTTLPSNFLERDDRMFDSDSEEYPDSDDGFSSLNETEDEDDSRTKKTHVFKPIKGKEELVFCEGMLFRNRAQFAGAIRHHSILQGKQIRFTKNETTRVRAKCRVYVDPDNGKCKVECPWEIFASERKKGSKTLQVKKYNPNHNCGRIWNNKLMNSEWLSMMYFDEIRISPTLKVSEMMEKVRQEFKCNVSLSQCYRTKHKVLRKIEGSMDEQYAKLWDYCHEIHRTNPVVEIENTSTWTWFLQHLIPDLEIVNEPTWTIISDKQKGLENAIKQLLPAIEHRHCVKHLHNNFKNAGFPGKVLHDKMWELARASYVGRFNFLMGELEKEDPKAFEWLSDPNRDPCHWSRSHFILTPKCDILVNNLCKPFNKAILCARDKPILTMLERLRTYFMDRLVKKREFATKWVDELGPKIHKKIEKIKERYGDYIIHPCGEGEFEARGFDGGQHTINLKTQTCSCRRWDLTGIPCEHAARVIVESGGQPEEYIC
ncbi:hypothetical protein Vadar_028195 [Vaccinium darrowii]|uniref:Uncharacterized protein n=1 Tax=Vaccinium darrowii TaxID=229202 RepID=A0ACB7X4E3_9ERIC|nr:hypothetical protein Vadar_028195 [Vaccinium darrowii]